MKKNNTNSAFTRSNAIIFSIVIVISYQLVYILSREIRDPLV